MEKILGKIENVKFGIIDDYPFLMGVIFSFNLTGGTGVGCGGKYTVNTGINCKWAYPEERNEAIARRWDFIYNLLKDAKVDSVERLKGMPVEVSIDGNCFQDFRILTEVL
jgi:hypothetical protein